MCGQVDIRYKHQAIQTKAVSYRYHQLLAPSVYSIVLTFLILSTTHFPNNTLTLLFRNALLRNYQLQQQCTLKTLDVRNKLNDNITITFQTHKNPSSMQENCQFMIKVTTTQSVINVSYNGILCFFCTVYKTKVNFGINWCRNNFVFVFASHCLEQPWNAWWTKYRWHIYGK